MILKAKPLLCVLCLIMCRQIYSMGTSSTRAYSHQFTTLSLYQYVQPCSLAFSRVTIPFPLFCIGPCVTFHFCEVLCLDRQQRKMVFLWNLILYRACKLQNLPIFFSVQLVHELLGYLLVHLLEEYTQYMGIGCMHAN